MRSHRRPLANFAELSLGWRRRLADVRADTYVPARHFAHFRQRTSRMHRVDVGLTAPRRKAKDAKGRDDGRRAPAKQAMAPAPVGRAIAVTRRGDEGDALDQAAPLVGHE